MATHCAGREAVQLRGPAVRVGGRLAVRRFARRDDEAEVPLEAAAPEHRLDLVPQGA